MEKKHRIYGLDILRALAITLVMSVHSTVYLPNLKGLKETFHFINIDGVTIFFVLSGYLIGQILIKQLINKPPNLKGLFRFWINRWLRTIPAYYFTLFLLIFLLPIIFDGQRQEDLLIKLKYFIFSQNLYYPHPGFFPEAWSLSIEEWFYLITPCFLFVLIKKHPLKQSVIITILTIIISVTLIRLIRYIESPINTYYDLHFDFRKQVITRLDSIMFGFIGAYLVIFKPVNWLKYKTHFFTVGLFLLYSHKIYEIFAPLKVNLYLSVFQMTVSSIGTLFLLPLLSSIKTGKGILYNCITFISLISYSMYLLNLSVIKKYFMPEIGISSNILNYITFWVLTVVLAYGLYRLVELPFMNLRKRINF